MVIDGTKKEKSDKPISIIIQAEKSRRTGEAEISNIRFFRFGDLILLEEIMDKLFLLRVCSHIHMYKMHNILVEYNLH
jgi:hypothetical protein